MKVSVLQENLQRGLSIVSRAVGTRSTLPVLSNVLVTTDDGRLRLSATNLEVVITCWVGAKVAEEGAITVPARTLQDLVSTLPQDKVELELVEQTQTLHLQCARTQANIKGIDAKEFPIVPEPDPDNRIRVEAGVLKHMINQVAIAAATDDARPTLTGVCTTFEDSLVTMAATDGFRLSVKSAHIPTNLSDETQLIIPSRALQDVSRVISDDLEAVYISLPSGRNQIIFDLENVVIVSQLIDGNFPDYRPIIPTHFNTRAVILTAEFRKACKIADIFARDASNTARVTLEPGEDMAQSYATVEATSSQTGDNIAQVDADIDGSPIEIAFNVKYMNDVLGVIQTTQVALETTNPMEPGVIKPVGENDFIHVIMPMQFGT